MQERLSVDFLVDTLWNHLGASQLSGPSDGHLEVSLTPIGFLTPGRIGNLSACWSVPKLSLPQRTS